jgi:cytochrome c biogenesis protein
MGKSRSFSGQSRQPEKTTKLAEVAIAGGAGGSSIEQIDLPTAGAESSTGRKSAFTLSRAVDKVLGVLSSVPCGITLLVILITCCMIGMLIEQQELETFAKYYAELTPGEKIIYGRLGFFGIYHVWYFNLLLLLLSLNIILASIDHFPAAWSFVRKKKLTASPTFAQAQRIREKVEAPGLNEEQITSRAVTAARALGFKTKVTRANEKTTIFAERGAWNRLGAYAVHVALLTIFTGGFLTSRGHTGGMWVEPGKTSDKMLQQVFNVENATTKYAVGEQELQLPFEIEGIDIQQKLIDKDKSIDAGNTLDWLTRVKIRDEKGEHEALIHLNKPYDYRGYRLFQASFMNLGSARYIHLNVTPGGGGPAQDVTVKRNEETKLADGTRLRYVEFNPHFVLDRDRKVQIASGDYKNPAAHLEVVKPDGEKVSAWAFSDSFFKEMAGAPFLKSMFDNQGGYRFELLDFEKVPQAHMLSIQYDPGSTVVYAGFGMLCMCLIGVFFFSHQRLWIVVEDGAAYLGGDANRNRLSFEDKVRKIGARITGTVLPETE